MSEVKSTNIRWHGALVTRPEREQILGARGCVVWLTGLSASGKSTIGRRLEQLLLERRVNAYVLDGDNIRFGLNRNLGFSPEDRAENIRRIGEVAKLFSEACTIAITAFISPYRADRDAVRALLPAGDMVEVFIDTPVEVCEQRDPKGLYAKARAGEIAEFTGVSAPYEAPLEPELVVKTAGRSVDACAGDVVDYLISRGFISAG